MSFFFFFSITNTTLLTSTLSKGHDVPSLLFSVNKFSMHLYFLFFSPLSNIYLFLTTNTTFITATLSVGHDIPHFCFSSANHSFPCTYIFLSSVWFPFLLWSLKYLPLSRFRFLNQLFLKVTTSFTSILSTSFPSLLYFLLSGSLPFSYHRNLSLFIANTTFPISSDTIDLHDNTQTRTSCPCPQNI